MKAISHTHTHTYLLHCSQLPGHHCLICVLLVQCLDVYVCVCMCSCVCMCPLYMYIFALLLFEAWPAGGSCRKELRGTLGPFSVTTLRKQPVNNSLNFQRAFAAVVLIAAVHLRCSDTTALGVYLWLRMCSFPLWLMLKKKEVRQLYLPYYDSRKWLLLWLSSQPLLMVPDLADRSGVLSVTICQQGEHLDSICIFLTWKNVCVCDRERKLQK